MKELVDKYAGKLALHGICDDNEPIIGGLDADIVWSRDGSEQQVLTDIMDNLNINSILFSKPAEPFLSIMDILSRDTDTIYPEDSETRTFLHDIPVAGAFEPEKIIPILKRRKTAVVPGRGIISFGTVSPEQAFVTYSSVCFSLYVKFLTDYYYSIKAGKTLDSHYHEVVRDCIDSYGSFIHEFSSYPVCTGPFHNEEEVAAAMSEAGRLTVSSRMVDSFFGNISCRLGDTVYISQTGSSLDELEGHIDPCPMDGSSSAAVTASSELSAHKSVYQGTGYRAILHGHPKFSVIQSMICDDLDCANRGLCFKKCSRGRHIADVPIVPGEVGTGPTGISTTLPPALSGRGAIVWGHGLFTTGKDDFTDAFASLLDIEKTCFEQYCSFINYR